MINLKIVSDIRKFLFRNYWSEMMNKSVEESEVVSQLENLVRKIWDRRCDYYIILTISRYIVNRFL